MIGTNNRLSGRTASCAKHLTRGCGICFPEVHVSLSPAKVENRNMGFDNSVDRRIRERVELTDKVMELRSQELTLTQIAQRTGQTINYVSMLYQEHIDSLKSTESVVNKSTEICTDVLGHRVRSKLDPSQVIEIYQSFLDNPDINYEVLSLRYGVSQSAIHSIRVRNNWTRLLDDTFGPTMPQSKSARTSFK